jgi:hypothetical protein
VCDRRYVFNAIPFDPMQPFSAQQKCPVFDQPIEVSEAVKAKRDADQKEYADLVKRGTATAPLNEFRDGGMNPVFASKFPERNPNGPRLAVTPADAREGDGVRSAAADTQTGATVIPAMASANDEKPGVFDKIGSWLKRNPEAKTEPPATQQAAAPEPAPAPAPRTRTVSAPAPKAKHTQPASTAPAKPAPAEKPVKEAQQQPAMQGAAPILSSSSFSAFR